MRNDFKRGRGGLPLARSRLLRACFRSKFNYAPSLAALKGRTPGFQMSNLAEATVCSKVKIKLQTLPRTPLLKSVHRKTRKQGFLLSVGQHVAGRNAAASLLAAQVSVSSLETFILRQPIEYRARWRRVRRAGRRLCPSSPAFRNVTVGPVRSLTQYPG